MVILNRLFLALLPAIVVLNMYELISYASTPNAYRFGSEVAGWRYNSESHYLGLLWVELLLALGAMAIGISRLGIGLMAMLRGTVLVLFIAVNWFL